MINVCEKNWQEKNPDVNVRVDLDWGELYLANLGQVDFESFFKKFTIKEPVVLFEWQTHSLKVKASALTVDAEARTLEFKLFDGSFELVDGGEAIQFFRGKMPLLDFMHFDEVLGRLVINI